MGECQRSEAVLIWKGILVKVFLSQGGVTDRVDELDTGKVDIVLGIFVHHFSVMNGFGADVFVA